MKCVNVCCGRKLNTKCETQLKNRQTFRNCKKGACQFSRNEENVELLLVAIGRRFIVDALWAGNGNGSMPDYNCCPEKCRSLYMANILVYPN